LSGFAESRYLMKRNEGPLIEAILFKSSSTKYKETSSLKYATGRLVLLPFPLVELTSENDCAFKYGRAFPLKYTFLLSFATAPSKMVNVVVSAVVFLTLVPISG